jgi:hypothetical protein
MTVARPVDTQSGRLPLSIAGASPFEVWTHKLSVPLANDLASLARDMARHDKHLLSIDHCS